MKEIQAATEDFITSVRQIRNIEALYIPINDFKTRSSVQQQPWRGKAGVYMFIRNGHVVYVGKALGTGLRNEIKMQIRSTGNPKWKEVVQDDNTQVCVLVFPDEHRYLAPAMEPFFIKKFASEYLFNLREQ